MPIAKNVAAESASAGPGSLIGRCLLWFVLGSASPALLAQTTGEPEGEVNESEAASEDDTTDFIDEYTLPTAAAPVAIGGSMLSSTPVGQNTQAAINPPPGVGLDANTGFYPSLTIGWSYHDNPARVAGGEGRDSLGALVLGRLDGDDGDAEDGGDDPECQNLYFAHGNKR